MINLSSAAQAPVNLAAMASSDIQLDEMSAYSQSKLAITMWSRTMAIEYKDTGPLVVSVNPGSLLASKMVKEGFGIDGKDIGIGADILIRAALSEKFSDASGKYFDNDSGQFAHPHADALDIQKCLAVEEAIKAVLAKIT